MAEDRVTTPEEVVQAKKDRIAEHRRNLGPAEEPVDAASAEGPGDAESLSIKCPACGEAFATREEVSQHCAEEVIAVLALMNNAALDVLERAIAAVRKARADGYAVTGEHAPGGGGS